MERLLVPAAIAVGLGACGRGDEPVTDTLASASVGTCNREPAKLGGAKVACESDLDCPCGSFCDGPLQRCTFSCMLPGVVLPAPPPPPAIPFPGTTAPCAAGSVCDDRGHCTSNAGLPGTAVVLSATPSSLATAPGGPDLPFAVRLRLTNPTPTELLASQGTVVRVIGRGGAEVSCNDGTSFAASCELTSWSFAFDGAALQATRTARVRRPAGPPAPESAVLLAIDTTGARVSIPVGARPPLVNEDGLYAGVASSPSYPDGIRVTARVRLGQLLVSEPTRRIAPDGALLLDLDTTTPPATRRRTVWLREPGAPAAAGGIVGEYGAGLAVIDLAAGTLKVPLVFDVPGTAGLTGWKLDLAQIAEHRAQCTATADCAADEECASPLQACVPAAVATPTTAPLGNALDDSRSAAWWTSAAPHVSALGTTGPDLVEALLCTTDAAKPGRLGVAQIARAGMASRSGDLACIDPTGAPTASPGAVGIATLADRAPEAQTATPAVLQACLADLARDPLAATASFADHFGASVGPCANLSRFASALRLLAVDPLGKGTAAQLDPRGRGLLARLTQQWAMLQGLVASTGVSQRTFIALDPTPAATTRAALTGLLDTLDRGWAALLDRTVAPSIRASLRWAPTAAQDDHRDYRLVQKPIVYWPFGGPSPTVDLIRGVSLVLAQGGVPGGCGIPANARSFDQWFDCPGYTATLPATAPSLGDDPSLGGPGRIDNLTITMNVDRRDHVPPAPSLGAPVSFTCPPAGCSEPPEDEPDPEPAEPDPPPYTTATLIATPTLAIAETLDASLQGTLVLVHPTATGVELTTVTGYGALGALDRWPGTYPARGSQLAVVRDAARKLYTVHVGSMTLSKPYVHDPVGTLDWVPARTIRLGAAGTLAASHYWKPYERSYGGVLDDVAVFDHALSARDIERIARARGTMNDRREVWPQDLNLATAPTHEITAPTGAMLLEAQLAGLTVAARLLDASQDRAQIACEGDEQTAAAARAELAAIVARVGRTLRQSHLVEGLAADDASARAEDARKLLRAKRLELSRALEPATCTPPFQMADDEVPLYHSSISPDTSATNAFFAASDHLLGLAEDRAGRALAALEAARTAYVQARQSQIQQLADDNARAQRIDAITAQFGDNLRRLCGIAGQTNAEIVDAIVHPDPNKPFSAQTCFIVPTAACLAQANKPLVEADPTCYRGQLGGSLMSLRAAYFAHQAAYQAWQAAISNAEGAERLCVWKEMDAYGCSAANRHKLTGVTCPPHYHGTLTLTAEFNKYLDGTQRDHKLFALAENFAASVVTGYSIGGDLGAVIGIAKGVAGYLRTEQETEIDRRRREHDAVLALRATEADIRACWTSADQYERAIRSAEQSALQAQAQLASSAIAFGNGTAEAAQLVLEIPATIQRELTRPSIPIAFHYWLDERIATYDRLFATARRYTYMALRATEYDMQTSYTTPQLGKPLRAAVLGASHPQQLIDQLLRMRDQTNPRQINGRFPSLGHLTFDVGAWQWGLPIGAAGAGQHLGAYLRDVYSTTGQYRGRGLRISYLPRSDDDAPVSRCAERLWRVAVGAFGFPATDPSYMHAHLIKRNVFASRICGADPGLRTASIRPGTNLLVAGGEAATLEPPATSVVADTAMVCFDADSPVSAFRNRDDAYNGSSTELSLQGLYGDYILLFPKSALEHGLVPENLIDLSIRFDIVSIDDSPQTQLRVAPASPRGEVRVQADPAPIVVD